MYVSHIHPQLHSPWYPQHVPILPLHPPPFHLNHWVNHYQLLQYWLALLVWPCASNHSCFEFMSALTMLPPKDSISQHSSPSCSSCLLSAPCLWLALSLLVGWGLAVDVPLELSTQSHLFSPLWPGMSFCWPAERSVSNRDCGQHNPWV